MTDLSHGTLMAKGEWLRARVGLLGGTIEATALVSCPDCGKGVSLSNHRIGTDGTVTPSLVCPHGCGFNDEIHLEGWGIMRGRGGV